MVSLSAVIRLRMDEARSRLRETNRSLVETVLASSDYRSQRCRA
jgi:hypothetical protein